MSDQDVFYILGGTLVALAVVLSFVGLRWERFPGSRAIQVGLSAAVAVLVVATASYAWMSAEEEQDHREAELEHATEESAESGDAAEALEQEGQEADLTETTSGGETASAEEGEQVFADFQCGGCHTLADAGATGTTGPALDSSLQGKDEAYIRTAIVDPNEDIAQGYPPDVMPQDYEQQMEPAQLDALVAYLAASAK